MTLRTLFAIPIAVILIITLSMAGMITGEGLARQESGRTAVAAVEQMRLLLALQSRVMAERAATNIALALPAGTQSESLIFARGETDRQVGYLAAIPWKGTQADENQIAPIVSPPAISAMLGSLRATIDRVLALDRRERTFEDVNAVMPAGLELSAALGHSLSRASLALAEAEPELSGLLTISRLAASLRVVVAQVVATVLPHFNLAQPLSAADLDRVKTLLHEASQLTQLLGAAMEVNAPTERMRTALADLRRSDSTATEQLNEIIDAGAWRVRDGSGILPPQRVLIPWGERITTLLSAISGALFDAVTTEQAARDHHLYLAITAFGVVVVAVLESIVLLSQRVVGPLAQLGQAITRIAAGDRSIALRLHSGTREISEMVTAVETLRQAALVADAASQRRQMAARYRDELWHQALGIVQTVREPAHALERGVAELSQGIDATIALVTTATRAPPSTLGAAAEAVRAGLAEMRESAAELDATLAAADSIQAESRPDADFMAHILAVQVQVDRRGEAVRGFVQPSLVALRDAAAAPGGADGPALRNLVTTQFECIEETVATVASMFATMTRAIAIVRDLPLDDDAPIAA